ncbi:putative membrane protein YphA (DoxX/SURF4 family) [Flavobacterium sp. CG_9.1]|uniref:MauE/DoxX family redox-associated membrane protein n=1 Tax=Flavobacterium sp. CG_9.1 TaxID=2787728 RepID=UPI0018CBA6FB|nr:MauE/DoxX family redox-associated membrane protein [Flavobacterium sp. CG_9.1]MBG6063160.1 putative membrane protein YphA (DoxX/SURF4 family) [Flavobacterium sp. CG_9.1]
MKFNERIKNIVLETICLLFVLLFVYAAVSKLLDFENFQVQLGQSPLLSSFAGWVAWTVPVLELLISLLIIFNRWRIIGLFAAFSLMIMFTTYIVVILNFSSFVPCSCGGILEKMGWSTHLIFNVFFVALSVVGICILSKKKISQFSAKPYAIYLSLISTAVLSTGIVVLFFIVSEDIMHHRNNFVRRFPGDATKVGEIDLDFNSYYFAGAGEGKIYLGNFTAPLLVTTMDKSLLKKNEFKIHPNRTDFKFQSVQVRILPPNFYLVDGTVPVIFKGKIADWNANLQWNGAITFSHYQLIDSLNLVFRSNYNIKGESILGTLYFGSSPKTNFNANLLQKQIDGIFDVDGYLHFDKALNRLVYIYLYRNQFIVADQALNINYRGKTIDTISKSQIKVVDVTSRKERKLAAPPLLVNKSSAVSNNLLFVNSALIGQYEPLEMWEEASIIDVYNLNTNTYVGSFYIYDYDDEKLKNFFVLDDNFYGFIGSHLVQYKLNKGLLSTNVNNDQK